MSGKRFECDNQDVQFSIVEDDELILANPTYVVNLLNSLQEENEQLKEKLKKVQEKLKDANDEIGYWKEILERYRNSARLDLDECTIIQKNKKYVGKVKTFVKYENEISIDLYDLKEAKVVEDE